jgi:hypothetical protein
MICGDIRSSSQRVRQEYLAPSEIYLMRLQDMASAIRSDLLCRFERRLRHNLKQSQLTNAARPI